MTSYDIEKMWGLIDRESVNIEYLHNDKLYYLSALPRVLDLENVKLWAWVDSLNKNKNCSLRGLDFEKIVSINYKGKRKNEVNQEPLETGYYIFKSAFFHAKLKAIGLCWETELTEFIIIDIYYKSPCHEKYVVGGGYKHERDNFFMSYYNEMGEESQLIHNEFEGLVNEYIEYKNLDTTLSEYYNELENAAIDNRSLFVYKSNKCHIKIAMIGPSDFNEALTEFKIISVYHTRYNHKIGDHFFCRLSIENLKQINVVRSRAFRKNKKKLRVNLWVYENKNLRMLLQHRIRPKGTGVWGGGLEEYEILEVERKHEFAKRYNVGDRIPLSPNYYLTKV